MAVTKANEFFVRFWGVRGSIPCPGRKTQRYGGNTPTVCSGESEVIGSWKMIEILPPRIARITGESASGLRRSISSPGVRGSRKTISPPVIRPGAGTMRMIACETTDFPDPDSPASATVSLLGTRKLTPSTTRTTPPDMLNWTFRSLTVRTSGIAAVPCLVEYRGS